MAISLLIIFLIVLGNEVIYQDNFVVITGEISLTDGSGIGYLNYPNGYNYNNCIVISAAVALYHDSIFSFYGDDTTTNIFSVRLTSENIRLGVKSIDNVGTSNPKKCMVVLMKK